MCKFVVFHSEEFTNPLEAFLLGVLVMCGNVLCEITNAISTQSQTNVVNIVTKFVGFKILVQVQDYYLRARHNFEVKASVQEPLIIDTNPKKLFGDRDSARKSIRIIYFIYKLLRTVYTSVYFYYFPLLYLSLPLLKLYSLFATGEIHF
jgi:hypothetical protein